MKVVIFAVMILIFIFGGLSLVFATIPDTSKDVLSDIPGWTELSSEPLGFYLKYPSEARLESHNSGVRLLFRGISIPDVVLPLGVPAITILRERHSGDLQRHINDDLIQSQTLGQIISPLRETTVAGRRSYTYTDETAAGWLTRVYVPINAEEAFLIYYDLLPELPNWEPMTNTVLVTFRIIEE